MSTLGPEGLAELDRMVEEALGRGDERGLRVLGYGEISLVLGWPAEEPVFACKRLPAFPDRARFDAYGETLADYVASLGEAGVEVVPTEFEAVGRSDGRVVGYAVQPALDPSTLGPAVLAAGEPSEGHPLVEALIEAAARTVNPRRGLDAQLSNWVWETGGRLRYLDVTTPMLWSAGGDLRLDLDLLVQPLPAALRPPVRRFLGPKILDSYRDLREVMEDVCGNLLKERLEAWLPAFLAAANRHLSEPLGEQEVRRYYRSDARLWEFLLRVRKLDRAWQQRVRRRPYPYLLPGRVQR
ncbi:MAG: DUF6206 family protein [Solirubrobacterales bacterium]